MTPRGPAAAIVRLAEDADLRRARRDPSRERGRLELRPAPMLAAKVALRLEGLAGPRRTSSAAGSKR